MGGEPVPQADNVVKFPKARKDRSDPLWDKRRWYIERGLMACVAELAFCSIGLLFGWLSPEDVDALSNLILAVNVTGGGLLSAYIMTAEYGSIKKGTVVSEEVTVDPGPPATRVTHRKETRAPGVPTEDDQVARG